MNDGKRIRQLLNAQISESAFADFWNDEVPPFSEFLNDVSARLSSKLSLDRVEQFEATIKSWGDNRVRIDGTLISEGTLKGFYAEVVWLQPSRSYRCTASIHGIAPKPDSKTVGQFIEMINSIQDENETIFEGQVIDALEGLDEESAAARTAYPAIFYLFERFPDEDFGNPGSLVHLMEKHGEYEDELAASLHRTPSIPSVTLVNRLLNSSLAHESRQQWLHMLRDVADSTDVNVEVKELALEFIEYQHERDSTEPRDEPPQE